MSAAGGPDSTNRSSPSFLSSSMRSISLKAKNLFKGKTVRAGNEATVSKGIETADVSKKAIDSDVAGRKKENYPTFRGTLSRASAGAKSLSSSLGKLTINSNTSPEKAIKKYETALTNADAAKQSLANLTARSAPKIIKETIQYAESELSKLDSSLENLKKSSSHSSENAEKLSEHLNKGMEAKTALQNEINIGKAKLAQNNYDKAYAALNAAKKDGDEDTPSFITPEGKAVGDALQELNNALGKIPGGKIPEPPPQTKHKGISAEELARFEKTSKMMPGNVKYPPVNSKPVQQPPPKPSPPPIIGGHRPNPKTDDKT